MRVVIATHNTPQWLGINKYFYMLAKYLKGVDVSIVVDSPVGRDKVAEICDVPVTVLSPVATGGMATMRYCWNLGKYLKGQDFDILHCGHVLPFFYLMNRKHRPVVFQPFGNEAFTLAGRGMNATYCKLIQPIVRYCAHKSTVVVSEGLFQDNDMRKFYPSIRNLDYLPVGVDTKTTKSNYETGQRFKFLTVNSLLPYEGLPELIEAFKKMVFDHSADLTIVGTGPLESTLKAQADGFPVKFLSNIPEEQLSNLYRDSDCFVCTSHESDVQMGVLESLASGLPVISREEAWLPESVIRFKDNLAERMAMMAEITSEYRASIGARGIEDSKRYSFTTIAEQALRIYAKAVA